jgi:hypothetical protein
MRDLVALVVSSKRIETHRNEDKKHAGPGARSGKSRAPLDAIKHRCLSARRLIEGEDEKAYRRLAARLVAESMPKTVVESMLVDQMVGDLWRLRRVEQAERAYFEQVRASAVARVLRTFSARELELLPELIQCETLPVVEGVEAISSTVRRKLQAAIDPDKLILDGVVSPDSVFPYSGLEHIRRSLVRDLMHKSAYLAKRQDYRLTIKHVSTGNS